MGRGRIKGSINRGRSKQLFHLGLGTLVERCPRVVHPWMTVPSPSCCVHPSVFWFLHKRGGLKIVTEVWNSMDSQQLEQPEGTVHLGAVSVDSSAHQYQRFPKFLQIHIFYLTQLFLFFSMENSDSCDSWQLFHEVQLQNKRNFPMDIQVFWHHLEILRVLAFSNRFVISSNDSSI